MTKVYRPESGLNLRLVERDGRIYVVGVEQDGTVHDIPGVLRCAPCELIPGGHVKAELTVYIGYGLPDADNA